MSAQNHLSLNDLHSYVDKQLDGEGHDRVAGVLAQHPAAVEQTRAWSIGHENLRLALIWVAKEPLPLRIQHALFEFEIGQSHLRKERRQFSLMLGLCLGSIAALTIAAAALLLQK